jgi:hypothetical protein
LQAAGFSVVEVPDAGEAVRAGRASLAAAPGEAGIVLLRGGITAPALRAEAALREALAAPWRLDLPAPEANARDAGLAAGWMAAIVAFLYVLYGVVLGVGLVARDRDEGSWEAEHGLPLPFWVHGAARLAAGCLALWIGLLATLALLHALIGIEGVSRWLWLGAASAAAGVGLGLLALSRASAEGFSGPLSRALSAALLGVGLGFAAPKLGAFLPICALSAAVRGEGSGLALAAATALAAVPGLLAVRRLGARGIG